MDTAGLRSALADPTATVSSETATRAAATELENWARHLVHNMAQRREMIAAFSDHSVDSIWDRLGALWTVIGDVLDPSPKSVTLTGVSENAHLALARGAAKLERNLIAGVHEFQAAALSHVAQIRRVIFNVTTFVRIEDPNFFALQAFLGQLLCNLVSPVDPSADAQQVADEQLNVFLSGNRDDDVVIRLLDSRDAKVNIATLHLLNNLTRNSPRLLSLMQPSGVRWLSQILTRMDDWIEHEDGRFDVAVMIVNGLIDAGAQAELFAHLAAEDEPVTPSQVTLLKLVDAWLDRGERPNPTPSPNAFLLPAWHKLAAYTAASMNSGEDDGRLGAVLVALMLATEGLSAIVLAVQGRIDAAKQGAPLVSGGDEAMVAEMKSPSTSIIPQLVSLLGATHAFLPRVKPAAEAPAEPLPFAGIKRDIVRLLSALCFDDIEVGNAVREAGGVELVLGMCEVDDRNPYLREHALLCVRNLMMGNPANQAIIAEMDPVGIVGENGELLPLPERMKKAKKAKAGGQGGEGAASSAPASGAQLETVHEGK